MPYFNLLDEPWLPVSLREEGRIVRVGLLDAFTRSSEISLLAETAPPSLVAEYRVLLAILHRALSAAFLNGWKDKDRARWYREGLPVDVVCDYLEKWREHFWLFHPEYPFMQVAALATAQETQKQLKPWMQISFDHAVGNTPTLFDHTYEAATNPIPPAAAVSHLLGYLQFVPGGLVKVIRESDNAGPLANSAVLIAEGRNLSQTLILNIYPSISSDADLPAWEKEVPTLSMLRALPTLATGYNDCYTRQTRAVLLLREKDDQVKWLKFAAGLALREDTQVPDPMVSFKKGSKVPVRLTFSEGRALWRDLPVLFPSGGNANRSAAVLSWSLHVHAANGADIAGVYQPFAVAGLTSAKAKLLRWRRERIVLPISIIESDDKRDSLNSAIGKSEDLYDSLKTTATSMLAEMMGDSSHKETRSRARQFLGSTVFASCYFSSVDRCLPELMSYLEKGDFDQADKQWSSGLRDSSIGTWRQLTIAMGASARALRAQVKFEPRFYGVLKKACPKSQLEKGVSA